jgi:CheY-like chemotaxis protein
MERKSRGNAAPLPELELRPLRVLVVDDLVDAAETLQDLLLAWGQEVRIAHTGPAALVAAREFDPHVVLLDLGLPGWDGFEVAGRLRELPGGDGVRLLAVTGYGQDEDVRRTREAGFDEHFTKPVDLADLHHALVRIGRELGEKTAQPPLDA